VNDQRDLALILKSRFPIVVIETHEEPRAVELLSHICNLEDWPLFLWNVTDGLQRMHRTDRVPQTYAPGDVLRHIDKTPQNGVYVLLDFHPYLSDPITIRLIKEIALGYSTMQRTLVLVSHRIDLPPELQRLAASFSLSVLDAEDARALLHEEIARWKATRGELSGQREAAELLARHLTGMCREDARRLIRQAISDDSAITLQDIARVHRAKYDMLGQRGILELELDTARFSDVGGQKNLKRWLDVRRAGFMALPGTGALDVPKGVLLLGVQGAGKSLAAKAVAGAWSVPLLRLDFGALYNKYHGETERNLREVLVAADAMAPCVLWIDEIEKGVSLDDGASDGGISRRVLGTLLTWMAERTARVFLVATANDVSSLPPELMRKGRMDEIFFVDLPDAAIRREIFSIHLERRNFDPATFDLEALAAGSEGFSGAEIEQAVVAALYEAHAESQPLATRHVLDEMKRTRPLSVVRGEALAALRDWASERTVPAN
jgi:SpoVK/Ycf46/Vps4 family AAA+-type ATPase